LLSKSTIKRIKERKTLKHSNPSQLIKRAKEQSLEAIIRLTIIAENLEEDHLEEIFVNDKFVALLRAILKPKSKGAFQITELLANLATQKLMLELPNKMVNDLGADIGKTWTYAKLLTDYHDKPLVKQPKK